MLGTMMRRSLLVSALLEHAERHHGGTQVVSRRVEGDVHRCTYRALAARCRRLANALAALGVASGDRVGTLAWNGYRHMELYYAVGGMGAVVHTINPRLHADQAAWIARHAQDKVLCFDLTFLGLVEAMAPHLPAVEALVAMTDRAHMPAASALPGLLCYEDLLERAPPRYDWPDLDENAASGLCYTSGTTGEPKGVLYTHRSTVLHSFAVALPDAMDCSANDAILPVVPMFHVNAWGLPYVACLVGAKLVLPGPRLDGPSLYELMEAEGVTIASGVPTVWQGLLDHVDEGGRRFGTLRRTGIGGSACPPSMIRAFERHGVRVMHGWGMTETSPLATVGSPTPAQGALPEAARIALQAKQGRVVFGVDMKVVDADGAELPWNGTSAGELMVRGSWIAARYFRGEAIADANGGWFPTGDVATIDPGGFMQITDRAKDLIKSGGEWISSVQIETIAADHPDVAMAACIAVPHPRWGERPLLVVVPRPGRAPDRDAIRGFFADKVAKWSIPDDVVLVEAIPLGPTGKMQKNKLRALVAAPSPDTARGPCAGPDDALKTSSETRAPR